MKKKKNIFVGPVTVLIILTLVVMVLTSILSRLGFSGQQTAIVGEALETSMVTIKNVFTFEGMQYVFGNVLTNYSLLNLMAMFVVSMIGISICEQSGLFKAFFTKIQITRKKLMFITVFVGIISSILGEYSYALLLPLSAIVYKENGYNPLLGVITMFLSITLGYGVGLIFDYNDYSLGLLTEAAATLDVDKNYKYSLLSTLYISLSSVIIMTIFITIIIRKYLKPKITNLSKEATETEISKKGLYFSNFAFLLLIVLVVYMIVPGLPGSGILLNNSEEQYIAKLFSSNSPFREGIVLVILFIMMICGYIYGKISKNIDNSVDYSVALSKSFDGLGYVFVLLFFGSILINVLDWTNFGTVLSTKLVSFIGTMEFSGIPLIITLFILVIIMTLFIPSLMAKWVIASPIIVPLFMRSNITPEFTQFIFKIADSVGKTLTPLFPCLLMAIAIMNKYNNGEIKITIFGLMKKYLSTVVIIGLIWILIIVTWYIVGIPLGIGSSITL